MQVIEFSQFGDPSQLYLAERPHPQADANSAVVELEVGRRRADDASSGHDLFGNHTGIRREAHAQGHVKSVIDYVQTRVRSDELSLNSWVHLDKASEEGSDESTANTDYSAYPKLSRNGGPL